MFSDVDNNKIMLEGAYRKLKSYYYYNKNFIVMRKKIVDFEYDGVTMNNTFEVMSVHLTKPKSKDSKIFFESLYDRIDFYALPKKFESPIKKPLNIPVSNTVSRNKNLNSVNFFIDMPIELHIIDTLWTLFLGKISLEENIITSDVYGNTILESVILNNGDKDGINFQNNRIFDIYFNKYTYWRNGAFDKLESNHKEGKNSVLISLDLQSYFYSVKFSFEELNLSCNNNKILNKIRILTSIMRKIFIIYKEIIVNYRKDLSTHKKKEFPLPIGLHSSMVLGNIYMSGFDNQVGACKNISYYGRYVDDLLFVYDKTIKDDDENKDVIEATLVEENLICKSGSDYSLFSFPNLIIQKSKIKIIYIDHKESRALIDVYNKTIRVIPSQLDPIPDFNLSLSQFDENAYSYDNFKKENKLRDIGKVNIDTYKVSRFFSSLIMKYSHINSFDSTNEVLKDDIKDNIRQIESFFSGSQCVEYYSNWMNYMYFLVITQRSNELRLFYNKSKKTINNMKHTYLKIDMFKKPKTINKKTKDFLIQHLDVCLSVALSLDIDMVNKKFKVHKSEILAYMNSNMFNHNLIAFPLSNYLKYDKNMSFIKMDIKDIGEYSNIEDNIKFKWSPRFIHYDELLLFLFYYNHKNGNYVNRDNYVKEDIIKKFIKVNKLNYGEFKPFEMGYDEENTIFFPSNKNVKYILRDICVPLGDQQTPDKVNIAVANIKIKVEDVIPSVNVRQHRWNNITLKYKSILNNIFSETHKFNCQKECEGNTKILVFPELSVPIYWIEDIIRFSKRTQTAIVAGLQYICDDKRKVCNYILTVLPFESGKNKYKNAFISIREKNDYSPIEKVSLAEINYKCSDRAIADYQIFTWKGINISSFLCYEFTDIVARSLLKGKCDIIAVPVFNPDTTYFSNIIDTSVRDIHAFIVQSNTSIYGDSRVTGPYDRDSKDIFKIKGGENDNVLIGTIDFKSYTQYQSNYYNKLNTRILNANKKNSKKHNQTKNKSQKPDIKPLSARYQSFRTNENEK